MLPFWPVAFEGAQIKPIMMTHICTVRSLFFFWPLCPPLGLSWKTEIYRPEDLRPGPFSIRHTKLLIFCCSILKFDYTTQILPWQPHIFRLGLGLVNWDRFCFIWLFRTKVKDFVNIRTDVVLVTNQYELFRSIFTFPTRPPNFDQCSWNVLNFENLKFKIFLFAVFIIHRVLLYSK